MEYMEIISNFLQNISIIIASIVAISGINSWRKETRWKRKFELASETISLLLQARDAIEQIRNPLGLGNEGRSRTKNENENPEDTERFNRAYIGKERYLKNEAVFLKLREKRYEFAAIFGEEYLESFYGIDKIINKIIRAYQTFYLAPFFQSSNSYFSDKLKKQMQDRLDRAEEIMYEEEGDKITVELYEIIDNLEKVCLKIMKRK